MGLKSRSSFLKSTSFFISGKGKPRRLSVCYGMVYVRMGSNYSLEPTNPYLSGYKPTIMKLIGQLHNATLPLVGNGAPINSYGRRATVSKWLR